MPKNVYVVGGLRTPFVKSFTKYSDIGTQQLMEIPFKATVEKFKLQGKHIDDVGLGAVISSSKNWNLAREVVLSSGLAPSTPGYNVQRACGTSYEATFQLFAKMALGLIDSGIAAGVDTNSAAPIELKELARKKMLEFSMEKSAFQKILKGFDLLKNLKFSGPVVVEPRTKLSMGQHAELMVKEWSISRQRQDEIALQSHQKAAKAYSNGFYDDLIVPVAGVTRDGFVRGDTSMEKLAKLPPAFDKTAGSITAGNASPLSDGASAVILCNDDGLKRLQLSPLARLVDFQTSAVDFVHGEGLLIAPAIAVAKLLQRNNLKLQDFDYYEIHEAFAGQVACTLKAWDSKEYCKNKLGLDNALGQIDESKMNVVGGSVALGHPFAATGTRILASVSKLLKGTKKRALISICTAGGMGIAGIVEGV